MDEFYNMRGPEAISFLKSSDKGLSDVEAKARLIKYGFNELPKGKTSSALAILLDQFTNILTILLILAGGISLFLGERIESFAMFTIVIINVLLGFFQEYKAEKSLEMLQKRSAPHAKVLRSGIEKSISARDLVPGDILILEAGDIVAADSRIFEASNLQIDEASLTGESLPSHKFTIPLKKGTSITDQENMAFMGTVVTYGKGLSVVTATGLFTEFGKIATTIKETKDQDTPLQKKFSELSSQIGIIAAILILLVIIAGKIQGDLPFAEIILIALSLAVATIPVALPTIVTIGLSVGSKKLSKQNMLVKKLAATESLGAVTVICSDKTGTITKNEMTVTKIYSDNKVIDVTGQGYDPKGDILFKGKQVSRSEIELLLRVGYLCNNAKVGFEGNKYSLIGDPTEGCLVVLGRKAGIDDLKIREDYSLLHEFSFDSERKLMSVIYKNNLNDDVESYVKGAPDILLKKCTRILDGKKIRKMTSKDRTLILKTNNSFAEGALRVLGFAYKKLKKPGKYRLDDAEEDLVFVGLAGMIDPPRDGILEAALHCKEAGIDVIIITGDHALTAKAVGEKIGILGESDLVLTGDDLDRMTDEELDQAIGTVRVIARALPIQKTRIVDSLKRNGHIVLMTGDGVNDSPALKKADVGVAMGITGTDVAKEVSKAILVDDNFLTIVESIKEGRNIYDKMIKSAKYLLACNAGEIFTILISLLAKLPMPLIPLQILLVNLVTDALPAAGLGMEPAEHDIMKRAPRDPKEKPLSLPVLISILVFGIIMSLGTILLFYHYLSSGLEHARTVAFTTLVMFQLFAVLSSRTLHITTKQSHPAANKVLFLLVFASLSIQALAIYHPWFQSIFETVPLSSLDWLKILAVSSLGFVVMEISKVVVHQNKPEHRFNHSGNG